MITPEIRELQAFLALVRTGSFSAAAQQLHVTQPAVSAQILKLEQIVGYPLFHRGPDGASLTVQGAELVPFVEEIVKEYDGLLHRAAYWKRSRTKQVKIWTDGSKFAQDTRVAIHLENHRASNESWEDLDSSGDWLAALKNLEVDVVLAGSFMKTADAPGIATLPVLQQRGVTLAWNPEIHLFDPASFSLPEAVSGTVILPTSSLALGFREFLLQWCKSVYGADLCGIIECQTEPDAVDACKLGLGILIFPGDADQRMHLDRQGLKVVRAFEFLLPQAFTFGVRYRSEEQNPRIVEVARQLAEHIARMA